MTGGEQKDEGEQTTPSPNLAQRYQHGKGCTPASGVGWYSLESNFPLAIKRLNIHVLASRQQSVQRRFDQLHLFCLWFVPVGADLTVNPVGLVFSLMDPLLCIPYNYVVIQDTSFCPSPALRQKLS